MICVHTWRGETLFCCLFSRLSAVSFVLGVTFYCTDLIKPERTQSTLTKCLFRLHFKGDTVTYTVCVCVKAQGLCYCQTEVMFAKFSICAWAKRVFYFVGWGQVNGPLFGKFSSFIILCWKTYNNKKTNSYYNVRNPNYCFQGKMRENLQRSCRWIQLFHVF